jgi:hypothetical protein
MSRVSRILACCLALALLGACGMKRHQEQIREGLITRGLHREAFLREWGPPSRTFSVSSGDAKLRTYPAGATWERVVYEVWEYQARETCLTFDGVRLISWEMGRTDCTPPPPREQESAAGRQPPPFPPYPQ